MTDSLSGVAGGFLIFSLPAVWVGFLRYDYQDISIGLVTLGFSLIALLYNSKLLTRRILLWILTIVVVFYPRIFPLCILSYLLLPCFDEGSTRKQLAGGCLLLTVSGLALLLEPLFMSSLLGFSGKVGSGLLFRSGLDGDTRYLDSILGAVFHPFKSEVNRVCDPFISWRVLLILVLVPAWNGVERFLSVMELVVISLLPYLFGLVVFPQHVSVHPYVYDLCLSFPAALGVYSIATQDMPVLAERRPVLFLAGLFVLCGGIMSQLIEISRALRF